MRKMAFLTVFLTAFLAPLFSLNAAEALVQVHMSLIVASNEGSDFNLVNDEYRDQLLQLFSYTSYNQLDDKLAHLELSQPQTLELPDGYQLTLTLQNIEKGRVLMKAEIKKEGKQYLDTVVSILRPGVVFLGGPSAQGGTLIIVLETGF
jgi:hypothetical protein